MALKRKKFNFLILFYLNIAIILSQASGTLVKPCLADEIKNNTVEQKTTVDENINSKDTNSSLAYPISPDSEEWMQVLMKNPTDKKIWEIELKRIDKVGQLLLEDKSIPNLQQYIRELAISNNYQLRGVALRHLERYPEALESLKKSIELLTKLDNLHKCHVTSMASSACTDILHQFDLTYSFFSNVYCDMKDETNEGIYLNQRLKILFLSIEKAIASKDYEYIEYNIKEVERLYSQLFYRISWISGTKELRMRDPRNFADSVGIGIGNEYKYGMTDPDEDEATFFTLLYLAEEVKMNGPEHFLKLKSFEDIGYTTIDDIRANTDIEKYIRDQMTNGNFVPAVKYLYCRYFFTFPHYSLTHKGHPRFECKKEVSTNVTFKEVAQKLNSVSLKTIDPATIQAFQMMNEGYEFSEKLCHNKGRVKTLGTKK
jgi:tetratricopeptide (TPR) repeat protein